MSLRRELLTLAQQPQADRSALAARYGVSRKTLYKWLARHRADDPATLVDRSRRPRSSPGQTSAQLETHALSIRAQHPAWGPRKIHAVMGRTVPPDQLPSVSSIGRILRRHDCILPHASDAAMRYQRFEHPRPNDLWQMDFKGDFALAAGGRCHPLTILDDHSRYNLLLIDLPDAQRAFDPWRAMYNHERPHEALGLATPASRYTASRRSLPQRIDPPSYHERDVTRALNPVGQLQFHGKGYKLSEAFGSRRVALRPTSTDGVWSVHFSRFQIALLDERDASVRMVRL